MVYKVLIERYINIINMCKPDIIPEKSNEGSLSLAHSLWMLHEMKKDSFDPLTTYSAWITWVQASLYMHKLIIIRHEIDITRDIIKQEKNNNII